MMEYLNEFWGGGVMAKIIRIRLCSECKWWDWDWCYHPSPSMQTEEYDAKEIDVPTDEVDVFPSWCPLEDARDLYIMDELDTSPDTGKEE
jgi:hypothetical protein